MHYSISFSVGGVHFRVWLPQKEWRRLFQQRYAAFLDHEPPDWEVHVSHAPDLDDTHAPWATHHQERTCFRIAAYAGCIDLRCRQANILAPSAQRLFSALERTVVFILIQALPRRGDSLLLHACGVILRDKGYLFCGPSGAGKTTIASLAPGDSQVLGDENIVIKWGTKDTEMISTPFWGQSTPSALVHRSRQNHPLHAIFLLHQASTFDLIPLRPAVAVCSLLATEKVAVERTSSAVYWLRTVARLTDTFPIYRLNFRPTTELWAFLEKKEQVLHAGLH